MAWRADQNVTTAFLNMASTSVAHDIAKAAKSAFETSQLIPSSERITALHAIRQSLEENKADILAANGQDLSVDLLRSTYVAINAHWPYRSHKLKLTRDGCLTRC
jgi:gamma-glutamyl phosphate reductase